MSTTPIAPSQPPFNQFQNFYPAGVNPYSLDPAQILSNNIYENTNRVNSNVNEAQRFLTAEITGVNNNIYENTNRINTNINEAQRFLTAEIAGVNKNIYDTIAQNGIAIERTAANGMATTERVNSQLATAIERNGANGMNATERTAGQVSSAVERSAGQVGSAVERNGGNITTAIERVAGEGRLTTTITDAASRQAATDSARDILRAVDRVGSDAIGNIKDTHNGLLGSIERNAGENRVQTLTASGQLSNTLTDVRHSILNDVNRAAGDVLAANQQSLNVLTKHVTDSAWESRTALATGFQNTSEEYLKTKHDLAQQASNHYSSMLLEGQKNQALLAQQASTHYATYLLEEQKSTALLAKQQDNNFAAMLSKQDNHFAALLLEQQKSKEVITMQLQDAKYEALKNKCDLSKELAECCCEIKMKVDQRGQDVINTVDTLDRNRLRDEVNTINNENSIYKILEFSDRDYGRGYGRRRHSRSRSPRRRSGSRDR
jgi:hypothetical protein